ncbi:hypothetical protein GCM10027046_05300 [Uliginosibacterium flavum]|uniref:PEP-CTERM sorting domain-containing protein n=1 Tax=Uliginosibacterium flavum TaxID=1396831 RepID=A0ABV2TJ09_9RHOO
MKKALRIATLSAAIVSSSAFAATDATLTFEGQSNAQYSASIVRSGYEIGIVADFEQHFHEIDSTGYGLTSNGTGIFLVDRLSTAYLKSADNSSFSLASFDTAWYGGSGTVTVNGYLNGTLTGSFDVSATDGGWTTQSGLSLGNVDYLTFNGTVGGGGGMQLDNINVLAVPEPSTYAMMLGGLMALGFVARKKRQQA